MGDDDTDVFLREELERQHEEPDDDPADRH
jgi:hypothetical protein